MNIIEVKKLKKHFGKTKAVDGISFNVGKGDIFGFLGPNGAGKTTTIRMLMDFIRPQDGEIKLFGNDAHKDSVKLKKKIGYLSGNVRLYNNWTGQRHIDFLRKLNGKHNIADKLIKRLDFDPTKKAKTLSSGNRQKLGLILTFMFEPELLIFDEPTNALDPLLQNEVYEMIKESVDNNTTVFMSSHNLVEVERICSQVGIIKNGKMVASESIVKLKEKKLYQIKACLDKGPELDELRKENVKIIEDLPNCLMLSVKGDINPTLKILSNYNLKDLQIERAGLEEIFLEYYEK